METNKLLTLEEIDAIENSAKENNDQWNETVLRLEKVVGLLATARAYWEMKQVYDGLTSEFDSSIPPISKHLNQGLKEKNTSGLPQIADDAETKLRDAFATIALKEALKKTSIEGFANLERQEELSIHCYEIARAMMEERASLSIPRKTP